jgi:hypothetical protein
VPELPFAVGVQWHPEELAKTDEMSAGLFYGLVSAAASEWHVQVPEGWSAHVAEMWSAHGATQAARALRMGEDAPQLQPLPNPPAGVVEAIRANCA